MCRYYSHTHIFIHPRKNCFIVSQLFSIARHVRCFKLGSKPSRLYVNRIFSPKAIVPLYANEGVFSLYIYLHIRLSATEVLNSCEELGIYADMVAGNSSLECSMETRSISILKKAGILVPK